MRLGLFGAIFGALLCTLAIGAPIPIGPRPLAGGQPPLWRPAGMDSIDIVWHHSPVLRLATRGDTLRGRAAASYVGNLLGAMLESDFAVAAVRVECE
jgi:hypothetical protein